MILDTPIAKKVRHNSPLPCFFNISQSAARLNVFCVPVPPLINWSDALPLPQGIEFG
jgi:hypothetical protein